MKKLTTAEMVRQLRTKAATEKANRCHYSATLLTRAADLLERQAAPVPVSERLPGASDTRYEFSVVDEGYAEQAGGSAPTYTQALREGQHYLAVYLQDGPHTLELRRVEILDPDALPLPQAGEDVNKPPLWQPINTAPKDGTEILASDYDAIEIVSWAAPRFNLIPGDWVNRDSHVMFPAWWQPLADHPPMPTVESD